MLLAEMVRLAWMTWMWMSKRKLLVGCGVWVMLMLICAVVA